RRLFTGPLRTAILRRDTHCTWNGCTLPGGWCHVHHNAWWSRGGPTSSLNGAALCPRHHTLVHTLVHDRDLTATITATTVTWPT
ncbi:HNH endonuclease signature motif containing protein, partial [Lapillicoccus sp.]|uniref:HNH endonuclease n=1 Tax=Lapillicoccus sp. TaxID=1909287 RepID=UPI0025D697A7